ncbi:hypothetical protein M011DRAFT_469047 [Sporormia fimetaria CBS 119925]|uniref:Uncharacterized protein n=1 Tax=Sporormia fimetaria CBS 119925 TaxID=1340428 RepID=A0A6A6V911_9PLEO|nr:hypothetical protein M011DRAFT_469047 [Sporormia fimetaria CBS 119925]
MRHSGHTPAPTTPPSISLTTMLQNITRPALSAWLASPTRDIHSRLVRFDGEGDDGDEVDSSISTSRTTGRRPSPPHAPSPPHPHRSHSLRSHSSTSMAPACIHQSSTNSHSPPSLASYSTTATPTETSLETSLASHLHGVPLLSDHNGVLELRTPSTSRTPIFECSFWFLSCGYISDDASEWRIHCLSHFRGEEPPCSVSCPLCADFRYTSSNGWESWQARMNHVEGHHRFGHGLRTSRPEFGLYVHLWRKRLIGDEDLKELKGGNWSLGRGLGNVVVTNESRRERDVRGVARRQYVGVERGRAG